MRTRLVGLSLVVSLVLVGAAACSSGGGSDSASSGSGPSTTAAGGGSATTSGGSSKGGGSSGGKVDCDALRTAQQDLLSVQLLAQLRDPESIKGIKDHTIGNLDLDKFLASMKTLHALDTYGGPLGDPKAAIDVYEKAANDAKPLFDAAAPAQADIDAYNASIGTTAEFLGHQTAIAGAFDTAGC
jgi:hypothetical protein